MKHRSSKQRFPVVRKSDIDSVGAGNGGKKPRRIILAMDYYLYPVHQGIVDYARRAGWILDASAQHMRYLPVGWQADGMLTYVIVRGEFWPMVRDAGLPTVNMSSYYQDSGIPSVQLDNFKAGQLAADHLVGRGFVDLTMVQFSPDSPTGRVRRRGFETNVLAHGRTFHPLVCPKDEPTNLSEKGMSPQLRDMLARLPKPLGVFTEGDDVAIDVIYLCQQMGLRVPEDVAVIGIDNDPLLVNVAPVHLTSVDNNLHRLGFEAAQLLDRILDGEEPPTRPLLVPPRSVVQRQSTDTLAVPNSEVAAAIAFLRTHFREQIDVSDVVRASNISRRRLQDLFVQHLHRTISEEITINRIEFAKRMLFETSAKMSIIAKQSGFKNGSLMSKIFLRELKMSPLQYRRQNQTSYFENEISDVDL